MPKGTKVYLPRFLAVFCLALEFPPSLSVASEAGDRVLLIIGAGHVKILSDFAVDHPDICLVPVAQYVP